MARIILVLLLFIHFTLVYGDTLKKLFFVHRHGNRSPENFYKSGLIYGGDPYANKLYWPGGIGQLTNRGRRRMFEIGRRLRDRYDAFLSDNIREVHLRSSDKDRAIESLILISNGLYRPKGEWNWNENDNSWQPIALHTIPLNSDSMLNPDAQCQAVEVEKQKFDQSVKGKSALEKNEILKKKLENISNTDVGQIYDCLLCEMAEGYKIPEYFSDELIDELRENHKLIFWNFGATKKLQRLRTGVFLNELVNKIGESIHDSRNETDEVQVANKLNIYSSHDKLISPLLSALNIHDGNLINFGAVLIFELHEHTEKSNKSHPDQTHSIRILYLNDTGNDPLLLKIPSCSNSQECTVQQFRSAIEHLTLTHQQWKDECSAPLLSLSNVDKSNTVPITFIVVLCAFVFIIFVTLVVRKRTNPQKKSIIDQEKIQIFGANRT